MTSLATLAHTAPAAQPFNGLFYATAATVIPVLFLAIAVQGRLYQDLVDAISKADRRERKAKTERERRRARMLGGALFRLAGYIVAFGVISEIAAIVALYQQSGSFLGPYVISGTIFMIIAAAAPPAIVLGRYALAPWRRLQQEARPATSPETGKTDPA